jgi:hypothetical protein
MLSSQFRQSSSWHDPAEAIASSPPDLTCTPLVSRCTARVSPRRMPPRTKLDDRFEFPPATAGIVAFRPTYGRVSSRGTVPNSWTYQVGPLCRAVEDTAIMLGTIAGYDELDPASVDVPVPKYGLAFQAQVGFSAGPLFRRSRPGGRQGSGASTYLEARRQLDVLRRQIRNVFTNVDLLILPTVPSPPVPIGQGAEPTAVSPTQHSSLCLFCGCPRSPFLPALLPPVCLLVSKLSARRSRSQQFWRWHTLRARNGMAQKASEAKSGLSTSVN